MTSTQATVHRPRRRRGQQPQARQDHRPLARSHGAPGREEGRQDSRRRRLAHPRPRQRPGHDRRSSEVSRPKARLHLPALSHRWDSPAYTEPLPDEKGATAAAFLARAKFCWPPTESATSTGSSPTTRPAIAREDFARIVGSQSRHQKTKPCTLRHNRTVERYPCILAEELLYARDFTSEDAAFSCDRGLEHPLQLPPATLRRRRSATSIPTAGGVTNLQPSYS